MSVNLSVFAIVLVLVVLLPNGYARSIPPTHTVLTLERTREPAANIDGPKNNATSSAALVISNNSAQRIANSATGGVLRHLAREKRSLYVPFGFHTRHLPCDIDMKLSLLKKFISFFPRQCIWAFNKRYISISAYRIFKLYQTEAFMFGQYHERLRRFEMDPHTWDYASIIVDRKDD